MISYFNEEQQDHMKDLAKIPRNKRCNCGWYIKGQCPNCNKKEKNEN